MMTQEQIEKAFEKCFEEWQDKDEWNKSPSELEAFEDGFKAAFVLLMPVIEKLQESNDRVENILVCSSIADHAELIDGAYEIITETQQQVQEMLKQMGGKENE